MGKKFNTTGACIPERHYMVDLTGRLASINKLIDNGDYFVINRARQYGKTTTLRALQKYLEAEYLVISLDFQMVSFANLASETEFVRVFAKSLYRVINSMPIVSDAVKATLATFFEDNDKKQYLFDLFAELSNWCGHSAKPVVLIIDEVDNASNSQVFMDFLAQLRAYYLQRDVTPTFQSVILAGVYDIKNVKVKIRPDEEHKINSPWNIATDFNVNMSFSAEDISGMLMEYEADHKTGMNIQEVSAIIYDYTSGYPFLVSRICKLSDEVVCCMPNWSLERAWTNNGIIEAVKLIVAENNTLFESLMGKVINNAMLSKMLEDVLFAGKSIAYNTDNHIMNLLTMYGFIYNKQGFVAISNRIFEMRLYNYFLSIPQIQDNKLYDIGSQDKNQFINNGKLNMKLVLQKFVEHFNELYGDQDESFLEEEGRKFFLLYLRPIINGTGNYYIEARTRNMRRTDVVVDYHGEQFVIELKIWRGQEYHNRGEKQLSDYLDYYKMQTGYMISFNFNKHKQSGVYEVSVGDKLLIEALV